jgi:hypothetical protein
MTVENMTFMLDRLGQDCAPLQFVRELTQNAIEAIRGLPDKTGEIIWDTDWNREILTDTYKLAVIDTGVGMTGEEMEKYINRLSSSMHRQSSTGNFGVGAKIAAATRNHAGLVYLSWKDGVGCMTHLWRNPDTEVYGLRPIEWPDGSVHYWAYLDDAVKPAQIKDHGTMVVLLGNNVDQDTMQPPPGTPMPSRWILRYLNTRYFRFPEGITIKAREGWELPQGDSHNFLRTVPGQGVWLRENSAVSGSMRLQDATAYWWIIKADIDQNSGHVAGTGHMAALYQDELYEMTTGRAGVTRLQSFGVIFGHSRVVIYVEPDNGDGRLTANTARTSLQLNGELLPWADWAAEFRENLPEPIKQLMEEVTSGTTSPDHQQAIRDRLKQIRDIFRLSRYRPTRSGKLNIDEETFSVGGIPRRNGSRESSGSAPGGGKGGRAGDIYGLFLSSKGIPGEEFHFDQYPEPEWVSLANGKRTPPDLEDRAAKYLPQMNKLLINADFRVFVDMVDRWAKRYSHAPGSRTVIEQVVQEWFEQELMEAVMGAQALRGSAQWTVEDFDRILSEEALTAVVLPRYHIDNNIKRALGAKLGTLKEMKDKEKAAS